MPKVIESGGSANQRYLPSCFRLMAKGAADKKGSTKKADDKKNRNSADDKKDDKQSKVRPLSGQRYWQQYRHQLFNTGDQGKGSLKAATAVNVRHILCEKLSKVSLT